MSTGEVVIGADELRRFATGALVAAGATAADAGVCAEVLVAADLAGVDTHGVARLSRYVDGLRDGRIDPAATPELVHRLGGRCTIDAHHGLGQPAMRHAVDLAAGQAREHGIAAVTLRRSHHIGMAGWYAERAAAQGVFALVMTSTAPMVTPTNAARALLGTNPIAYAMPATGGPVCFDASTSVVPRGRLEQAQRADTPIPDGWAVDERGTPAVEVDTILAGLAGSGHCLLPVGGAEPDGGGHKGFGLALLVELLCGPLAGADPEPSGALGQFVLCLDLGPGVGTRVDALVAELRALPPLDPARPVRVPGEGRRACAARRTEHGIPLDPEVAEQLRHIAVTAGLAPPRFQPEVPLALH